MPRGGRAAAAMTGYDRRPPTTTALELLGPAGRVELPHHLAQYTQAAARRHQTVVADRSLSRTNKRIIVIIIIIIRPLT